MKTMLGIIKDFLKDERGLETVEYVLIAVLVVIAAIIAYRNLGTSVSGKVNEISNSVSATPGN
jgi:Flp pilus assembly pilin Flp